MKIASQDVKKLYHLLDAPVKVVINFLSQPEIITQPSILPYRIMLARMLQVKSVDDKERYLGREQAATVSSVPCSSKASSELNDDGLLNDLQVSLDHEN